MEELLITGFRSNVVSKELEPTLNSGLRCMAVTFYPELKKAKFFQNFRFFIRKKSKLIRSRKKHMFTFVKKLQHVAEIGERKLYKSF